MGTLIADGSTLNVNGKTITFKNAAVPTASSTHTGITGNVETDGQRQFDRVPAEGHAR